LEDAARHGLYAPENERDACGVGFVANIKGKSSHALIQQALLILQNLDHRRAVGADPLCGDGAGILIQIPDAVYRTEFASKESLFLHPVNTGRNDFPAPRTRFEACVRNRNSTAPCVQKAKWCWVGVTFRSTAACRCRRCA